MPHLAAETRYAMNVSMARAREIRDARPAIYVQRAPACRGGRIRSRQTIYARGRTRAERYRGSVAGRPAVRLSIFSRPRDRFDWRVEQASSARKRAVDADEPATSTRMDVPNKYRSR
jgi:hypothetical protein